MPITETFSKKETPLVADSLTALDRLRRSLVKCRDHATAPNIIRVAAHAGVLMADKYFALMDECEVYYIAIGTSSRLGFLAVADHFESALSPHYKLQWFRDRGWTEPQVLKVWERLITRWADYKATYPSASRPSSAPAAATRTSEVSSLSL